jgi:hypothetical protein
MSYKVTISGGTVLENCIEHVSFSVDTPNDYNSNIRNSMIITGQIDTEESTVSLYEWALIPATNSGCYKEITVEQYQKNLLVRKVTFSKAFVIDYSENYSNHVGTGTFTLYVRQIVGKEIECIGQTVQQSSNSQTVKHEEEATDTEQVPKQPIVNDLNHSTKKSSMSFTDRIAKQNEMPDNSIIPPAFKQTEFASSYESRIGQTPADTNPTVGFKGIRGESLCTPKPPPDTEIKQILDESGIKGIEYRNAVPDFLPTAKAQVEIDYMLGGTDSKLGSKARDENFAQADIKLAKQLNDSPKLAQQFGMKSGEIKAIDIKNYRKKNKLTWHEVNDCKTIQLVPSKINSTFGHLGGIGEINAGAFKTGGFACKA